MNRCSGILNLFHNHYIKIKTLNLFFECKKDFYEYNVFFKLTKISWPIDLILNFCEYLDFDKG